jgi:hypothetical protein
MTRRDIGRGQQASRSLLSGFSFENGWCRKWCLGKTAKLMRNSANDA